MNALADVGGGGDLRVVGLQVFLNVIEVLPREVGVQSELLDEGLGLCVVAEGHLHRRRVKVAAGDAEEVHDDAADDRHGDRSEALQERKRGSNMPKAGISK